MVIIYYVNNLENYLFLKIRKRVRYNAKEIIRTKAYYEQEKAKGKPIKRSLDA